MSHRLSHRLYERKCNCRSHKKRGYLHPRFHSHKFLVQIDHPLPTSMRGGGQFGNV